MKSFTSLPGSNLLYRKVVNLHLSIKLQASRSTKISLAFITQSYLKLIDQFGESLLVEILTSVSDKQAHLLFPAHESRRAVGEQYLY